jgi:hypothetical protein
MGSCKRLSKAARAYKQLFQNPGNLYKNVLHPGGGLVICELTHFAKGKIRHVLKIKEKKPNK